MKTIWKYKLQVLENQKIEMTKNAKILSVQNQYGNICIWALVDNEQEKEYRHFEMFDTGQPILYDMSIDRTFIGTVQYEGILVFHIFEYTGI